MRKGSELGEVATDLFQILRLSVLERLGVRGVGDDLEGGGGCATPDVEVDVEGSRYRFPVVHLPYTCFRILGLEVDPEPPETRTARD